MEIEFRALLAGSAAITALAPVERINWGAHPQGIPFPGVVLHLISHAEGLTMQGPDGLWQGRVQCDCFALTYREAMDIADAISTRLNGYRGGGFRGIFLDRQWAQQETGASDRPYRISMDFMTNWRRQDG